MRQIEAPQKPPESIALDRQNVQHQELVREWIASAIDGINEMHRDELDRRRVAARLF